jgi:hypothetical protein
MGISNRRVNHTSAETSAELRIEMNEAAANPREIFGYGRYGDGRQWVQVDKATGGLQPHSFSLLASRPKRGKSMLAAAWLPYIAEQALAEGEVVRVVTLEMKRISYQRRMAAILSGIQDPKRIKQGYLTPEEIKRYNRALDILSSLPIEYLSNEEDLTEEKALLVGNSPVNFDEMADFIRAAGKDKTYWWLLDHIGLLADLRSYRDVTTSIVELANKLAGLCHTTATGLIITHLTRASVGSVPTIESIAGSDQLARNADQIFLLSRPYMDAGSLSQEDAEQTKDGEIGFLQFISRDEGSGTIPLWWNKHTATFDEVDTEPGVKLPMPTVKRGR